MDQEIPQKQAESRWNEEMEEEFVSEPIKLVAGTFDTVGMTRSEPGLPGRFIWRDKK